MTMKYLLLLLALHGMPSECFGEDGPAPAAAAPARDSAATAPDVKNVSPGDAGPGAARFSTDAKWAVAGYNNNEIVYTILVKSLDTRIIRCTTELQGSYYENGQKLSISDRQSSTVFPDQEVQVGNWMGMDEKSGATYSVKCRPI
jgi:hypothetical protein